MKTFDEVVSQMKAEVLDEIKAGRIPSTVRSFSELHDYIDANELGGFCDDEIVDEMIENFGGRDENEGMPDEMMRFMNDAQHAIDKWLELDSTHEAIRP